METIGITIHRDDVYDEVAKATDYTGSKLIDSDDSARDRILASDDDLAVLGRFWDESVSAANESLKEMLVAGSSKMADGTTSIVYDATIEVSKSFDKALTESVRLTVRSYFIASIVAQWFKFANKDEAKDYFQQSAELMEAALRLLYSRKKPSPPRR